MSDPLFWAIAIFAALIVGLSKSGFLGAAGMMGVPLLALVMPARDAAGMMLPILLSMDVVAIWIYRRDANWKVLAILLPGAALGTLLGWALWSVVTDAQILLAVGIITLLFILDALLPIRKRLEGLPPSKPWGVFWGAFAGLTSFISHTGGPPFQIYTLPMRMPPVMFSATSAFFFATTNSMKLPPYALLGQLSVSNLERAAILAPIGLIGVFTGVWLVRRISAKRFYQITYVLIGILAIKLIYDGIVGTFFIPAA